MTRMEIGFVSDHESLALDLTGLVPAKAEWKPLGAHQRIFWPKTEIHGTAPDIACVRFSRM